MHFKLKVIRGKPKGHFLEFPPGEFMFGRGPECAIRPNSDLVSRQHCVLQITESEAKVRDLGSINGTLVNGQVVVGELKLEEGDTLELGPMVFQIQMESDPPAGDGSQLDTLRNQDQTKGP